MARLLESQEGIHECLKNHKFVNYRSLTPFSWPAGSEKMTAVGGFDLMGLMSKQSTWPKESQEDNLGRKLRWCHSDIKDISYLHTYPLFDKLVEIGDFKN